jgi:hypothetical protein
MRRALCYAGALASLAYASLATSPFELALMLASAWMWAPYGAGVAIAPLVRRLFSRTARPVAHPLVIRKLP